MTDRDKPNLLILTSSFPRSEDDETCGYIRDFARSTSIDFNVIVLTLPDRGSSAWPEEAFKLVRVSSTLPQRFSPLQAGKDLAQISERSLSVKIAAATELAWFAVEAFRLARSADVICSHWMLPSGLVGALLSRLLGKPHVAVEHSGALYLLRRIRGGRRLARFILSGSHRIVTVSRDLKGKLLELCPDADLKTDALPMGIDFRSLTSSPVETVSDARVNARHTVLFVGRLTKIKGVDVLLRSAEELGDIKLVIAGDGEDREHLQRLAKSLGVNAGFIGRVNADDRNDLLGRCDAVVIPSLELADGRTEGMPLVALEAMAAGRAVIASRVGGLQELIIDGQNGLLFDAGDHLMLADKLRLVFNDDSLRNHLGANARTTAAQYDWSRIGALYCEILKSSLRREKAREVICHGKGYSEITTSR